MRLWRLVSLCLCLCLSGCDPEPSLVEAPEDAAVLNARKVGEESLGWVEEVQLVVRPIDTIGDSRFVTVIKTNQGWYTVAGFWPVIRRSAPVYRWGDKIRIEGNANWIELVE